ncbi:putative ribonuclease [Triangularia verruculosa]|uniref:ribonuclease Z n=1 Tax=Triangularia verruculosa TaxID=2587418 RepID=A0AAN6XMC3_9PEZI|nr:putative ribonuclease [Triangularia verruculosa]
MNRLRQPSRLKIAPFLKKPSKLSSAQLAPRTTKARFPPIIGIITRHHIPKRLLLDGLSIWFPYTGRSPKGRTLRAVLNIPRQPTPALRPAITSKVYSDSTKPMTSWAQVVTTPTADTPGACVLLHFDQRRYLFGRVAEGTQRAMVQRKIAVAKLHNIFVTGTIDWSTTGGLPGLMLTLADVVAGMKAARAEDVAAREAKGLKTKDRDIDDDLHIYGGKNLLHSLATTRRFIFRKGIPLSLNEIRTDSPCQRNDRAHPDFEDDLVRVWHLPISSNPSASRPGSRKRKHGDLEDAEDADTPITEDSELSDAEAQHIRQAAVAGMFSSTWSLDTLHEMNLRDVDPTAKIFFRADSGMIEEYKGPLPGSGKELPDIRVLIRSPWPAAKIETLPDTKPSNESLCYIVKCHPRRGKFKADTAAKLSVPKTEFKSLIAGESVTLENGTVVTPEMVMEATVEGRGVAVIDIPTEDMVDSFLARPEWSDSTLMSGVDIMYWLSSEKFSAYRDERIVEFMKKYPSVQHVLLGHDVCPNSLALQDPADKTIKMNYIDPKRFPLLKFDNRPCDPASVGEVGASGARVNLHPKQGPSSEFLVPLLDPIGIIKGMVDDHRAVVEMANEAQKKVEDPAFLAEVQESQKDIPDLDTEIIPLGTGSALPSKYRNVSATLIRVPGHGSYLFDCGENTLGQLRRFYGWEGTDEVLKDLRAIYISHLHADHHFGTASLMSRWNEVTTDTYLGVIAAEAFHRWLREYDGVEPLGLDRVVRIVPYPTGGGFAKAEQTATVSLHYPGTLDENQKKLAGAQLPEVEICWVDHCLFATAISMTLPHSGLKIAYSGDCRPSKGFAAMARGAHLLLHECTFEDGLRGDAMAKKHSTISEALAVGRDMGARRILLTHFSQRYPKLPAPIETDEAESSETSTAKKIEFKQDTSVLYAFDHMHVKLGEFKQAEQFIPAIKKLLEDEEKLKDGEKEGDEEELDEEVLAERERKKAEKQKKLAEKQKKKMEHSISRAAQRKEKKKWTPAKEPKVVKDAGAGEKPEEVKTSEVKGTESVEKNEPEDVVMR